MSLSYMRKHEPFDELPLQYFPSPEFGRFPPHTGLRFPNLG